MTSRTGKTAAISETLARAGCHEIVIGLVGRVSSGTSTAAKQLIIVLEGEFGYHAFPYKMSAIIRRESVHVWAELNRQYEGTPKQAWLANISPNSLADNQTISGGELRHELKAGERIELLQDLGNLLRATFSTSYLSERAIFGIYRHRAVWLKTNEDTGGSTEDEFLKGPRHAHIIDSLKHPDEARLLKSVYGSSFFLFSVLASSSVIREHLRSQTMTDNEIDTLLERDSREKTDEGQKVEQTTLHADVFIRNEFKGVPNLQGAVRRNLSVVFGAEIVTPTLEESGMLYAAAASVRSSCLSQQVGAAVVSETGNVLAVGCNDVPRPEGGLYTGEKGTSDCRCFNSPNSDGVGYCRKDQGQRQLIEEIQAALCSIGVTPDFKKLANVLRTTSLRSFLEQSRSIHAEMDALVSIARQGIPGLRGATLYTTVFPCHNCARHIVASGIKKVVFLAPYEKSLALHLHADSLALEAVNPNDNRVVLLPYSGIAPKNIVSYFTKRDDRKDEKGLYLRRPMNQATPVGALVRFGFEGAEAFVISKHEEERSNGRRG